MIKVQFHLSVLKIESDKETKTLDLSCEIGQVIVFESKIIVRFKLCGEQTPSPNIICLDVNGQIIWKIQDPDDWRTGKSFKVKDSFGGVWLDSEGELWAQGGSHDYLLDKNDGKIIREVFTK